MEIQELTVAEEKQKVVRQILEEDVWERYSSPLCITRRTA